jgi:RNA polymerase sigma-70 factor (ECF subfamily)
MNPSPQSGPYPNTMANEASAPREVVRAPGTSGHSSAADLALIERMQAGDGQALSEFYGRWFPVVSAVISRIVKSADDVEDVVEETFWQVWRQASRFTADRGSMQTWVLTIARSRALDRLRATRRLREDTIDETGANNFGGGVGSTLPSTSDPSLDAEHSERREFVVAALSELPREQREALELGYFGGLSQSEIAERTGQPLGTVKTRMRLAMLKLRDRLAPLRGDSR